MVTGDPVLLHSFSYADYLPCGVSAMVYSPKHNMLIIGSCPQTGTYVKHSINSCTCTCYYCIKLCWKMTPHTCMYEL